MRRALVLALAFASLPLSACGPKLLPGTEIRDTDENREILEVVTAYRSALENRNVDRLMQLVSPSFFETSGTSDGADDYNYDGLRQKLEAWAQKTRAVRLDVQVKQIAVKDQLASVQYFYDLNFQTAGAEGKLQWQRDSDAKAMTLKRQDGVWKITSGI